ncbi:TonB-dependent receptor [Cellulophaga lytica]|uniref:TonB-dependent receptor n=1 Tax=Cellulophaga lytica TaxID=979 RepID=UPI000B5C5E7C|nr:TonB-dependent receptor [Cellulophaga lytica]SNQ43062.1 TonB-dependent receptor [Cellulophaga lytica]
MRLLLLTFCLLTCLVSKAQETGSVVGKLTDKEMNNDPLPFANVLIKGTTKGTTSDFDGLYEIANLEPGTYTVVFSYVGYETVEIPNVAIVAGKVTTINVPMAANEGMMLDEIVITTVTRKDSETALLLDQKKAVEMKTAIGAQELARKGVSDVATAVTKTTGISKQEGSGSVFVRGLGDRYNVTTMNGLPLPTNNPSRKNIDLDIFSTDIVEYIGIDKTYNAKNYGDFAGANIDISSKNYKGSGFLQLGVGTGINTEAIGESDFYLNDGPDVYGFYTNDYPDFPLNNYNYTTSWDRESAPTPIVTSLSLSGGDSYTLGEQSKLSFFAVGTFDNDYKYKEGVARGSTSPSGLIAKDFDYTSYEYSTNSTLMANIGYTIGRSSIKYNSLYVNTSTQKQQEYNGVINVFDYAPEGGGLIQRGTFERTSLFVNQLLGDHKIGEQLEVNWGASYNTVESSIPNRKQTTLSPDDWDEPNGPKSFRRSISNSDNHRFYQDLTEDELAANLSATYKFKKNEDDLYDGKLTVGYSGRFKEVDFEATQFNFNINTRNNDGSTIPQPIITDPYNLDAYFTQENLNAGLFSLSTFRGNANNPIALQPQTYNGNQDIHAAYTNLEYAFNSKFTLIAGLRVEQINQSIDWSTSIDPAGDSNEFEKTEFLPALSLKYELNDKQNLKFAASKTYTLPQFKERALFLFEDVTTTYTGNPSLYTSTDYNFDLKWEMFPNSSEIISLGVFGKYIENPINEITINSASNVISYVNSGDWAKAYGVELEVRKDLFATEKDTEDSVLKTVLSAGFNASYMNTNQELNPDKIIEETTAAGFPLSVNFSNEEDGLTGASDLLLNGDISFSKDYSKNKNITTTIAYNYFSDRIYALGVQGKGNLVDKGFGSLDFIAKAQLNENIRIGLSAKNILNPSVERFQDEQDVTVLSYKRGANVKLSLSYNF